MRPFQVHRSNRQELLSARLATALRENPPADPFAQEIVIVQSLGMRRWLQMELARQNGLCAGVAFPFPQTFLHDLLTRFYPLEMAELPFFSREVLQWRIFAWFDAEKNDGAARFPELTHYFTGDGVEVKKWQLAARLAGLFDQYMAYRPDWLLRWQTEPGADWQAALWQHLAAGRDTAHPAALRQRLLRDLATADVDLLPRRLAVFGLATLAPWYLEALAALSRRVPVDLYVLQPTPEFWADLETPREIERRRKRGQPPRSPGLAWNPLLAAWGKTGRDFFGLLLGHDEVVEQDDFAEPAATGLLAAVQDDLLQPERRPARKITAENGSIQVHSCAGPMREVEVLYDQLLALFERLPGLEPRDILVLTPQLEVYAPLVEAVFGAPETTRIPFSLADGATGRPDDPGAVLLQIFEVAESRFEATKVLALLEIATLRERFELAAPDLEKIREWIITSGIRWGLDGAHRQEETGLDFRQNSWEAGLDRLLLGFAMEPVADELFDGILPLPGMEGSQGALLGRLLDFIEQLKTLRQRLRQPVSLQNWAGKLRETQRDFFLPEQLAHRAAWPLKEAVEALEKAAGLMREPVPFAVLRLHLQAALQADETQLGFLNGGVTFCACRPMRSVPFRVIALLGLNDGDFPRNPATSSLDRLTTEPRLGDRSLREDDRYLFLETLLSAREVLYLSYCGRSARDGKERRPSVVISELLEYLDEQYLEPWSTRIVTRHPLQAFSPDYFAGASVEGLRSYSQGNFRAALALSELKTGPVSWISEPLPEPGEEWRTISPQDLAAFFVHPAKFFATRRVGLQLPRAEDDLPDHEPFELNQLERYQLKTEAVEALRSSPGEDRSPTWQAAGILPPGAAGTAVSARLQAEAGDFFQHLTAYLAEAELPPLEIDLALAGVRVTGLLDQRRSGGGLRFRPAKLKAKDRIEAWIAHLLANASGLAEPLRLVAEDQAQVLPPLPEAEAREHLGRLLELYWRGLREPLPFFPKSAGAYLAEHDLAAARKAWRGSAYGGDPEAADPWFERCFGHLENPLDEAFVAVSETILGPMPP